MKKYTLILGLVILGAFIQFNTGCAKVQPSTNYDANYEYKLYEAQVIGDKMYSSILLGY